MMAVMGGEIEFKGYEQHQGELLPAFVPAPMPVSIVHPYGRSVPRRVRAVMTWLAKVLAMP